jgi:hypothetical protein
MPYRAGDCGASGTGRARLGHWRSRRYVIAQGIELDVTEHDRYLGRPERVDPEDAFLCFPFEIEVFTDDPFDHEALVGDVSTVLDALVGSTSVTSRRRISRMSCRAAVGVLAGLTEAPSLDARAVRLMPHRKGGDDLRPFCVVADRLGGRSGRDRKQLEIVGHDRVSAVFRSFRAASREPLCGQPRFAV